MVTVSFQWIEGADRSLGLPGYESAEAAGADLRAHLLDGPVLIDVRGRALIPIGLRIGVPQGFEVQIRPRSGLALKHGIVIPNSPGTIDSDYRGEIGVIVLNSGDQPFEVIHGMRIAQMVVAPVVQADLRLVENLDNTARGAGGFGSTGVN